jgi:hypothetical protein
MTTRTANSYSLKGLLEKETLKGGLQCLSRRWAAGNKWSPAAMALNNYAVFLNTLSPYYGCLLPLCNEGILTSAGLLNDVVCENICD